MNEAAERLRGNLAWTLRSVDSFHADDCEIFIGTAANGRHVEKPCTCGLDAALTVERKAMCARIREKWQLAVGFETDHEALMQILSEEEAER